MRCYSYLISLAGFTEEARQLCQMMVDKATAAFNVQVNMNAQEFNSVWKR